MNWIVCYSHIQLKVTTLLLQSPFRTFKSDLNISTLTDIHYERMPLAPAQYSGDILYGPQAD